MVISVYAMTDIAVKRENMKAKKLVSWKLRAFATKVNNFGYKNPDILTARVKKYIISHHWSKENGCSSQRVHIS
jgi:hypothetical protein